MRVVELVQPVTDAQIGDVALVMRDNLPAMVDFKGAVEDFSADALSDLGVRVTTLEGLVVTPQEFGAIGDGIADDTVAMQAAINFCDASDSTQGVGGKGLYIPAGKYRCGPLNITRPIHIEGDGSQHTEIIGVAGMTVGQFIVRMAHDGVNYPSVGLTPAKFTLRDLRLVGPGKTDVGAASGVDFANPVSNSVYTTAVLSGVEILNYASAALKGQSWNGYGRAYDCNFHNNGGNNVDFNSCFDWRFIGGEISTATGYNVLLAGSGQFTFLGVYNYGAGEYNFGTYRSGFKIIGGALDSAQKGGLLWGDGVGGLAGHCVGVSFFNNSRAGANLYPDIFVSAAANSELRLDNCDFIDPNTINTNYNVFFEGTTQIVYHSDCQFKSGSFTDPQVTNLSTAFVSQSGHVRSEAGRVRSLAPLRVEVDNQYSGLSVVNRDLGEIATIVGWDSDNLNGVLTLFQADGSIGQRLAAPGSGTPSQIQPPGPYVDDADALANGVLPNRQYRQTGAGVAYVGGGVSGGSINANTVYASRSSAAAATIPATQNSLRLYHQGVLLEYKREPSVISNPALTTNGGSVYWSPAGEAYVEHWGADNTGATNCQPMMQAAIDWVSSAGGGNLRLSRAAYYVLDTTTVIVRPGVVIVGVPGLVKPGQSAEHPPTFLVKTGRGGTSTAAIRMTRGAGLIGVAFHYPDQVDTDMVDPVSGLTLSDPIMYGWAITTDPVSASDTMCLRDIFLGNAYLGINLDNVGQTDVRRVYGNPLSVGFRCNDWLDVNYVEQVHFWPFSSSPGTALREWVQENGEAFHLGNIDGTTFGSCFVFGYKHAQVWKNFGTGGPWFSWIGGGIDFCTQPIRIEAALHKCTVSDCYVIGSDLYSSIAVESVGDIDATDRARVTFSNVTFWNVAAGAVVRSSTGDFVFDGCTNKAKHGDASATLNDVRQYLVVNEGNGSRVEIYGGGGQKKSPVGWVSGTDLTWVNGVKMPTPDTDVTASLPNIEDATASANWTYVNAADAALSSVLGGYRADLSLSSVGSLARYVLPQWMKDECGVFVVEFDINTVSGSSGDFIFRVITSTGNLVNTRITPNGGAPNFPAYKVSVPFIVNPTTGVVYFDIVMAPGNAVIDVTNFKIHRANRSSAHNCFLDLIDGSNLWQDHSTLGMPMRFDRTGKTIWRPELPSAGAFIAGDTTIRQAPAAGFVSRWRCTTAGSPGTWKAEATMAV